MPVKFKLEQPRHTKNKTTTYPRVIWLSMIHDPMHHPAHLLGCAENKQFFAQMYRLHYGKKIREVRIIHRTLRESGFLLVKYDGWIILLQSTIFSGSKQNVQEAYKLVVTAAYSMFWIIHFDQLKMHNWVQVNPGLTDNLYFPSVQLPKVLLERQTKYLKSSLHHIISIWSKGKSGHPR